MDKALSRARETEPDDPVTTIFEQLRTMELSPGLYWGNSDSRAIISDFANGVLEVQPDFVIKQTILQGIDVLSQTWLDPVLFDFIDQLQNLQLVA